MTSPHHDARSIVVREAMAQDAAAITAVHLASRAAAMPWLPALHTEQETARWVREVVLTGSRVWVAEDAGAVVGYAALNGDVLDGLYLLPQIRRRGIGTRLLSTVRSASPAGLTLHVFTRNTAARAFYAHHGFEVVGTDDGSDNEEGLPDVTYRWSPARRGARSDSTLDTGVSVRHNRGHDRRAAARRPRPPVRDRRPRRA